MTLAERNQRTTRALFTWTALWLISLAVVAFAPKFLWNFEQSYTLVAIAVNLVLGYKMILANKQHLDGCDELQRPTRQTSCLSWALAISSVC